MASSSKYEVFLNVGNKESATRVREKQQKDGDNRKINVKNYSHEFRPAIRN